MLDILFNLLCLCGVIVLVTIAVFLFILAVFIILYTIKDVKKQLNKK